MAAQRADLEGCDLHGSHLEDAYLSGADLIRANLVGAKLSGVDLTRLLLFNTTMPDGRIALDIGILRGFRW
jgi:uncharacterized protein YjbI with pentapeptide repeats